MAWGAWGHSSDWITVDRSLSQQGHLAYWEPLRHLAPVIRQKINYQILPHPSSLPGALESRDVEGQTDLASSPSIPREQGWNNRNWCLPGSSSCSPSGHKHAAPGNLPASPQSQSSGAMEAWTGIPRAVTGLIPLNMSRDLDRELSGKGWARGS